MPSQTEAQPSLRRAAPALAAGLFLALASLVLLLHATAVEANYPARQAPAPQGAAVPITTPCLLWNVVAGAPVVTGSQLLGAAIAPNAVWGVGQVATSTLTERWDGATWTRVPSPNGSGAVSLLRGVVAVADNDVWAVGLTCPTADCPSTTSLPQSLIERWNGTQWNVVPGPGGTSALFGVDAAAANDVWAVGTRYNGVLVQTLITRWNGTTWTTVSSPNVGFFPNILFGVSVVAANDVWAVGAACGDITCTTAQNLTLHWNGTSWSTVSSPNLGSFRNGLAGVDAQAANNVWAVGQACADSACSVVQGLVMRWNGSAWSIVPSPNPGAINTHYNAIAAVSATEAWAVGSYSNDGTTFQNATIWWNGTAWYLIAAPNPGTVVNELWALAARSAFDIWAVGAADDGNGLLPQILHWAPGVCPATPTPLPASPTSTSTPGGPTSTPTAILPSATSTPTATGSAATPTATACAISFTDVDPNNPFYPFIRCLACRQIVSGYSDGTFRWGADVTRGQLSKIIANAAGLTNAIPSTQQTFSDVPNSNTFWLFVERLVGTGAISGYACGGAGEPCDPQNRPYFRWGANATRGQISKITGVTAGYNGPIPTTQQTFADVPSSNPFWLWIEELASRQIISGYQCGGPGEPCDPQQRPYFRWGANATRGQMSKIAANTFYPNCSTPGRVTSDQ